MQQCLVISDLHLFSRRSRAVELLAEMKTKIEATDLLVLNGDVFDFRWSTLQDMETTITAALVWLDDLLTSHPNLTIHYLLGNHDCIAAFAQRMREFSAKHARLTCHESFFLLNRRFFLHGDCSNRKMDGDDLRRFRDSWSRDRQRGPISRALYDGTDALGVSRKMHDWWFPQRGTVLRVAHYLDHVLPSWREEIDHCYFGHTHLPFRDHLHDGVMFHNTGSAIRDMVFQPLVFTCEPSAEKDIPSCQMEMDIPR